jgi:rubrerythrin
MRKCTWPWALSALILAAVLTWTDLGFTQLQGAENLKKPNPSQLAMLSTMPIKLDKVKKDDLDKQILRAALIAELDAITLYEQLASMTDNEKLKTVLLDVAKEEKTHVGEFQALLKRLDPEYTKELEHGEKEIGELLGK